jgi:membrane-associated phospholipid phosphatase
MVAPVAEWLDRGDGRPLPTRTALVAIAGYALFTVSYLAINEFSVGRPAAALYLPGESSIPFIPEFEFLYVLGYLLPVYAVFRIPTATGVARFVWAFLLTLGVAYAVYLVFPVYLERPILEIDSPATYMLSLEYMDHSYNHFPSLHVALVWLAYLAGRSGMRYPRMYVALAAGMSVAPVFIKQHYAVDLAAGAVLAWVSWHIAGRLTPSSSPVRVAGSAVR